MVYAVTEALTVKRTWDGLAGRRIQTAVRVLCGP